MIQSKAQAWEKKALESQFVTQAVSASGANLLFLTVWIWSAWSQIEGHIGVIFFLAVSLAILVSRFTLGRMLSAPSKSQPRGRIHQLHEASILLGAMAWAGLAVITDSHEAFLSLKSFIMLLLSAGLSATAANSLAAKPRFAILYCLLLMIGPAFGLLHEMSHEELSSQGPLALMLAAYIGFLVRQILVVHRQMLSQLRRERSMARKGDDLQALFDAFPGYVSWVDSNLIYKITNRSLQKSYGHDIVGDRIGSSHESVEFAEAVENFVHGEQKVQTLEFRSARLQDQWLLTTMSKIPGTDRDVLLVSLPISEIKELQAHAQLINRRMDLALQAGKLGIWEVDLTEYQVDLDPRLKRIFGFKLWDSKKSLRQVYRKLARRDRQQMRLEWKKALTAENGQAMNFEVCLEIEGRRTFLRCWGALSIDPITLQRKVLGIAKDITESRKQQEEIKNLGGLIETSSDMIAYFDMEGALHYSNLSFQTIYPTSRSPRLAHILGQDGFDQIKISLRSLNRLSGWQGEGVLNPLTENDSEIPVWIRIVPLHDADSGEIKYIALTATDMRERKANQAMVTQAARLASLGEMAGGIAHEINNPLAIISGKASLIERKISNKLFDEASILADLGKIRSTCGRITKIINGLRSFARDGEADPFKPAEVDSLLEGVLAFCNERMRNQGIDLQVKIHGRPAIQCREVQIGQVLVNLLNNAYDAVQSLADPWVRLECFDQDAAVLITVTDSGRGIPTEIAKKIMDPFFTTKAVGKGTGIGLSISRGIIEEHGGKLWLDTNHENTSFVIVLPKVQRSSHPLSEAA